MRWRPRRWLPLAFTCSLAGCHAAPTAGPEPAATAGNPASTASTPAAPAGGAVWDGASFDETGLALPADLNTARAAAQTVLMRPPVADPVANREIALHAALYRAAWESNVGHGTKHFLLEPIAARELPAMNITVREFRLRVLAALADLGVSIAWTTGSNGRPEANDFFPGTNHPATRLQITIAERREGGRVIRGETEDWTVGAGSSRRGFTATLEGGDWTLARDRVRIVR